MGANSRKRAQKALFRWLVPLYTSPFVTFNSSMSPQIPKVSLEGRKCFRKRLRALSWADWLYR
jgi:hypothetical protein